VADHGVRVDVAWARLDAGDERAVAEALDVVTGEERTRARRFAAEVDRRTWLLARAAVRRALGAHLATPAADVPLAATPGGRPYLEAPGTAEVAVAHSRSLVVVAYARVPVGVDVEDAPDAGDDAGVAAVVMDAAELREWSAGPPASAHDRLLRTWARKEALLKGVGTGFALEPRRVHVGAGAVPAPSVQVGAEDVARVGGEPSRAGAWRVADLAALPAAAALAARTSRSVDIVVAAC
jgi:4'-phosphopantetheinyl transferase